MNSKPAIKFYSPKRPKYAPGEPAYEQLAQMFKEGLSYTEISKRVGIGRAHVKALRETYFKNKTHRQSPRREKIVDGVFVNCILPILEEKGYECEFADNDVHSIRVNGHKCRFHKASNAQYMTPRSKVRHTAVGFNFNLLLSYKFVIVFQNVQGELKRVFVIPTDVILDHFDHNPRSGIGKIRLPVEGKTGANKPRVDWLEYVDAWHLLKTPNSRRAA